MEAASHGVAQLYPEYAGWVCQSSVTGNCTYAAHDGMAGKFLPLVGGETVTIARAGKQLFQVLSLSFLGIPGATGGPRLVQLQAKACDGTVLVHNYTVSVNASVDVTVSLPAGFRLLMCSFEVAANDYLALGSMAFATEEPCASRGMHTTSVRAQQGWALLLLSFFVCAHVPSQMAL